MQIIKLIISGLLCGLFAKADSFVMSLNSDGSVDKYLASYLIGLAAVVILVPALLIATHAIICVQANIKGER